jgi:transcriptional regulator with XRE-family HTH domain
MSLGENIYKYRAALGMSQASLADELEVSRQSVSKWENNTAIPDLDKLVKMRQLFGVSLDDIVFGDASPQKETPSSSSISPFSVIPSRIIVGFALLIFGMISFLLSIFWGDHLYFGEVVGELSSAVVVLLSISMLTTYNFKFFSVCSLIYFLYSLVCYGILNVTSVSNYLFTFAAGAIILVWFIILGTHATAKTDEDTTKGE